MNKIVLELTIVGKNQIYDFSELASYRSRYFDQALYEYTIYNSETDILKLRRVYDRYNFNKAFEPTLQYIRQMTNDDCEHQFAIKNFLDKLQNDVQAFTIDSSLTNCGCGNSIIDTIWGDCYYTITEVETKSRPIKYIVYDDPTSKDIEIIDNLII